MFYSFGQAAPCYSVYQESPMRLFYMTSAKHAVDDIQKGRLKVSLFNDLNDPFELLCAKLPDRKLRKAFDNIKARMHSRIGVICFSEKWDSPVMWSHYADKHRGICLGFDIPDEYAISIKYVGARDTAAAEAYLLKKNPDSAFAERFMTTKYQAWSYEKERRLYVKLDERDPKSGMYFYNFGPNLKLREFILGHRCETTLAIARKLVSKFQPEAITYKARLAFNTFDVVPNKNTIRSSAKPRL